MDNIKNPAKKPKLKKSYSNSTIFQKLMVDDVRNKILFTILCLLIYRLGCGITIPFVNTAALQTMFGSTSVLDYYNLVSGGALSQCAVFAIGVSAYINASIIIQLLTVAIPKLEEISKDIGGQKQINKITQYVGCGLAVVTAIGYFFIMKNYGAMKYTSGISQVVEAITVIAILTAGSQIVIWLGWLIDEKGIGNGISLIIFTGIISRWDAVISLFQNSIAMGKENGWWYYLMIPGVILFVLAATFYVVFASDAERRVPVQYAGKNVGNKASTGQSSYIPIKLIMSGVMPIIFSSTICSMPSLVTMFLDYNKHPSLYMALASWNSRNWIYDVAYVSDAINDQMQSSGPSGENNDSEGQRGEGSGSGSDGSDESDESGSSDSQSKSGKGKQGNGAGGSMSGSDTILIRSDKKTDENNESGSDEDSDKKGETSSEKNDSASQDASDSSTGKSGSDKKDTSDGSNSSSKGNKTDSSDKGSGSDSKNADGTSETDAKPNGSKSDEGKSDKDTKAEGGKDGKNTSAEPKKMTAKEAEKIKKEIDGISQKVPSSDNNDCTDSSCKTSSIFNSNNVGTDAKNNAGENVRQQSKQEVGKNPQDKEIRNIPGGSGLPEKSAYDDVTSIVSDMQRTAAEAKTEKQREKDLREEAAELTDKYKNMLAQQKRPDIGYFNQKARFLDGIGSISITRVVTPPVGAESVYQAVAGVVKSVSRPTQREIIKAIKDKRNGYKLTGLTMGRRVEASLIHHNDGKCFSKSKSPEDVPELCVGVLLDQSESTMGEIINYERLLALTIEDMCRSIEIPAIINGYSGGGGTVRIISYVEPNSVDRKNALRLTSMRADGGTPTAEALAYMLNRLEKRSEPSKILFVVTDGNSNNKAYLPMLLAEAKRNHIMVIAAGIGACRQRIHSEFPENFLDISDMNSMPRNICNIIKRKLVN